MSIKSCFSIRNIFFTSFPSDSNSEQFTLGLQTIFKFCQNPGMTEVHCSGSCLQEAPEILVKVLEQLLCSDVVLDHMNSTKLEITAGCTSHI